MKKLFTIDVWVGIVLMLFSICFWILSADFPDAAKLFPRTFLAVNFILSAILMSTTLYHNSNLLTSDHIATTSHSDMLIILEAYGLIATYFFAISLVGFYASTAIFLVVFMCFLRVRSVKVLVFVPLIVDFLLYLFFSLGLKLNLPTGLLF